MTSPDPELLASFYSHLSTHDADFASEASRKRLSERFNDVLLKLTTLVGAPKVLCAVMPLAKAEGDVQAKAENSKLNNKWHDSPVMAPKTHILIIISEQEVRPVRRVINS